MAIGTHATLPALMGLLLLPLSATAEPLPLYKDLGAYNEADWIEVRDPSFSSAGSFVQRNGYIENAYPPDTDTSTMFDGETGYAMRVLNGFEALNGKAELELLLIGYAAPSIFVRLQVDGDTHSDGYNCVVFNDSTPEKKYEGVNVWQLKNDGWVKVKAFEYPVPKNQKFKFGVEFVNDILTFFVDGTTVGSFKDPNPLPRGALGMCAIEGPSYFYSFQYTPYDSVPSSDAGAPHTGDDAGTEPFDSGPVPPEASADAAVSTDAGMGTFDAGARDSGRDAVQDSAGVTVQDSGRDARRDSTVDAMRDSGRDVVLDSQGDAVRDSRRDASRSDPAPDDSSSSGCAVASEGLAGGSWSAAVLVVGLLLEKIRSRRKRRFGLSERQE